MKIKDSIEDKTPLISTDNEKEVDNKINVEAIQPWSNVILKVKIPDLMFQELEKVYDYTMKDWKSFGDQLVGAVSEEPEVTLEIMKKFPDWIKFCLDAVQNFVRFQTVQNFVAEPEKIEEFFKDETLARITTMWFVNQKPYEYNPAHIHTNCKISAVCYLKTPKKQIKDRKSHYKSDGKITFINNTGTDPHFSNAQCSFKPVPGDMYIFPALQHHMVWPYRSTDPDDLRVSLSFNADVTQKSVLKQQEKQQEKMYEEMKKMKESENDKSADVSNINKSG